jgi:hypothetical protein
LPGLGDVHDDLRRERWAWVCALLAAAGLAVAQDDPGDKSETAPPVAAERVIKPQTVRIGAWNIEWLGRPDKRYGKGRGQLQEAEDLADYIAAGRVDILALAEICPTNLAEPERYDPATDGPLNNEVLTEALQIVSRKTRGRWEYRLFPSSGTTRATSQLTGIAWNTTRVTALGESRPVIEYEDGDPWVWYRPPWATMFSTGEGMTDLVVIPIHMKASKESSPRRAAEAAELVLALAEVSLDPDTLIIGDANCHAGDEQAIKTYRGAGFIDLNNRDQSTHVGGVPLDRVFVPDDQPEFGPRFQVFSGPYTSRRRLRPDEFAARYSDHYMVITIVKAGADDD